MPKPLMAANWKMFKTTSQALEFFEVFSETLNSAVLNEREVLFLPPFTCLETLSDPVRFAGYNLGAQNCYPEAEGAYTGEIAPAMLLDLGCGYVLTGHSERRHILGEADAFVGQKTAFALAQGLRVILCVGETLEQRKAGQVESVLQQQLEAGLREVPNDVSAEALTIAYEPVWAIGTGEVAQDEDISQAHTQVRGLLQERLAAAADIRIVYGGSVKPANCAQILRLDNVNGVLVGGASLQAASFADIVSAGFSD